MTAPELETVARAIARAKMTVNDGRSAEQIDRLVETFWRQCVLEAQASLSALTALGWRKVGEGMAVAPLEPTKQMIEQGLIACVTEIIRIDGPRPKMTKEQIEGTVEVSHETWAKYYMSVGATMRTGNEIQECYRAMLASHSPTSQGEEG